MKYILSITLLATFVLFSCNSNCDKNKKQCTKGQHAEATTETAEFETEYFGAEITEEGAQEALAVLTALETEDSVFIKVKGEVSAVCKVKGCWMTMNMDEENELFAKFKDYEFFVPLNCEGRTAIMEGWAYKSITSVEELKHYAEDEGLAPEQIEAITEPKEEYKFMADGVIML